MYIGAGTGLFTQSCLKVFFLFLFETKIKERIITSAHRIDSLGLFELKDTHCDAAITPTGSFASVRQNIDNTHLVLSHIILPTIYIIYLHHENLNKY